MDEPIKGLFDSTIEVSAPDADNDIRIVITEDDGSMAEIYFAPKSVALLIAELATRLGEATRR